MFCVPAAKVLLVYINGEDNAIHDLLNALEGDIQGKNERYLMILIHYFEELRRTLPELIIRASMLLIYYF